MAQHNSQATELSWPLPLKFPLVQLVAVMTNVGCVLR